MSQDYFGVKEIQYQWRGPWSDPTIEFNGHEYYAEDLEESLRELFDEDVKNGDWIPTNNDKNFDWYDEFIKWTQENSSLILDEMKETETAFGYSPEIQTYENDLQQIIDANEWDNYNFPTDMKDIQSADLMIKHGLIDKNANVLTDAVEELGNPNNEYEVSIKPGDFRFLFATQDKIIDDINEIDNLNTHFKDYLTTNDNAIKAFNNYLSDNCNCSYDDFPNYSDNEQKNIICVFCDVNPIWKNDIALHSGHFLADEINYNNADCFDMINNVAKHRIEQLTKRDNVEYRNNYVSELKKISEKNVSKANQKKDIAKTINTKKSPTKSSPQKDVR